MSIQSVALLENGQQIDSQANSGTPTYIFHVPGVRRGATYTLRGTVQAATTTSTGVFTTRPNGIKRIKSTEIFITGRQRSCACRAGSACPNLFAGRTANAGCGGFIE